MKKISTVLFVALLSVGLFSSCEEGLITISADYVVEVDQVTIAKEEVPGTYNFSEVVTGVNVDSVLEANGVDPTKLKSVKIGSFQFDVLNQSEINFDPLEGISAGLSTPNLPYFEVASKSGIPNSGLTTLILSGAEVTTNDLKPYTEETTFNLDGTVVTDMAMPAELIMKITITMIVEAS